VRTRSSSPLDSVTSSLLAVTPATSLLQAPSSGSSSLIILRLRSWRRRCPRGRPARAHRSFLLSLGSRPYGRPFPGSARHRAPFLFSVRPESRASDLRRSSPVAECSCPCVVASSHTACAASPLARVRPWSSCLLRFHDTRRACAARLARPRMRRRCSRASRRSESPSRRGRRAGREGASRRTPSASVFAEAAHERTHSCQSQVGLPRLPLLVSALDDTLCPLADALKTLSTSTTTLAHFATG